MLFRSTGNDQREVAVIPAATYEVLPAAESAATGPIQTSAEPVPVATEPQIIYQETGGFWRPLAIGAIVLALLSLGLCFFTWRKLQQLTAPDSERSAITEASVGKLFKALTAACQAGDANQAHRALFSWATAQFPGVRSLQDLEQRVGSDDFSGALRELEQHLFAPGQQQRWQGQRLMDAATGLKSIKASSADKSTLQPFNPI